MATRWIVCWAAIGGLLLAGCRPESSSDQSAALRLGQAPNATDGNAETGAAAADTGDAAGEAQEPSEEDRQPAGADRSGGEGTSTAAREANTPPSDDTNPQPTDDMLRSPGRSDSQPPAASRTRRESYPIQLSTGTALAQTLPTGTAMGFSVTYRFLGEGPASSSGLLWVIESSNKPPVAVPFEPKRGGDELYTFVTEWKPNNGPFRSFIGDRSGRRLSKTIDLR